MKNIDFNPLLQIDHLLIDVFYDDLRSIICYKETMNIKLNKTLKRLQDILPLEDRMKDSIELTGILHQRILSSFVYKGRILTRKELAQHTNNLEGAITKLSNSGMVIFSKNGDPVGAYPFTMEKREHMVKVTGHQV